MNRTHNAGFDLPNCSRDNRAKPVTLFLGDARALLNFGQPLVHEDHKTNIGFAGVRL